MSEVRGVLHGHQTGRGEQARLVGIQPANDDAHAALIRPASLSTPMKARTSCGGRAFGGLAMSSVRAHAAATSPLPISAATARGPQPPRQAATVPRPVLYPTTPARTAHTRDGSSERQLTLVGSATTRAGSGRSASRRQVRYSTAAPSPTNPQAAR